MLAATYDFVLNLNHTFFHLRASCCDCSEQQRQQASGSNPQIHHYRDKPRIGVSWKYWADKLSEMSQSFSRCGRLVEYITCESIAAGAILIDVMFRQIRRDAGQIWISN